MCMQGVGQSGLAVFDSVIGGAASCVEHVATVDKLQGVIRTALEAETTVAAMICEGFVVAVDFEFCDNLANIAKTAILGAYEQ